MKKLTILLILFLSFTFSKAQSMLFPGDTVGIWQVITFENACDYIYIDTSEQSIWQIGQPQKTLFNSSYSAPNVIVTDTVNKYPINNHSYFDLYVGDFNSPTYPHDLFFDFWHKFDSDTLKDGGYITVSWDKGITWTNIIQDSIYLYGLTPPFSPYVPVPNMYHTTDTLFNGEYGFSGSSNGWTHTTIAWHGIPTLKSFPPDTMIIRFNFISDGIDNQREGWMIDNIRLFSIDLGSGIISLKNNNSLCTVLPNPFCSTTEIKFNKPYNAIELKIYDALGNLIEHSRYSNCKNIHFDRTSLVNGVYYFNITLDKNITLTRKIMIIK